MAKKKKKTDRDYKKEYADRSQKAKDQRKKHAKARRMMGLELGDPREVDHKKSMKNGGSNGKKNLRVVSRKTNRKKGSK